MIRDGFGRVHDYLRISLTDNCNLRCFYCMPEEDYDFTPSGKLMNAQEIRSLAGTFAALGVKKIRLTGGEPLVRKDAADIISLLSELPVSLTLTTNATRLDAFMDTLREAGVKSVNISLDTLDRERFQLLTRRDLFDRTHANIRLALQAGMRVKVNMVVMKGINEAEILDFVEWTRHEPVHIRFIEFMPFTGNRWNSERVVTWKEILDVVGARHAYTRLEDEPNGTAKAYRVEGHAGTFAVISTMSAPFCSNCNRMRLTADGKLKNCLFSSKETDLLGPLRRGEDPTPLIHRTILAKAAALGGQFTPDFQDIQPSEIQNRSMITIGG